MGRRQRAKRHRREHLRTVVKDPGPRPKPPKLNEVHVSPHAVRRYQERFRPDLTFDEARREIRLAMQEHGRLKTKRPDWCYPTGDLGHQLLTVGYVVINEDRIALPVQVYDGVPRAVTCVVRDYDRDAA